MTKGEVSVGSSRDADWRVSPAVGYAGRAWRPADLYAAGLGGRVMEAAAQYLEVDAALLRGALEEHAVLRKAYDEGWKDWEAESIRRAEKALDDATQPQKLTVVKRRIEKGVLHTWEEETLVPPSVDAVKFKLERRDRERFGKDVRPESPGIGQGVLDRVSLYLMEKGLGAVAAEGAARQLEKRDGEA